MQNKSENLSGGPECCINQKYFYLLFLKYIYIYIYIFKKIKKNLFSGVGDPVKSTGDSLMTQHGLMLMCYPHPKP
ncbi:hypothetical protein K7X86_00560, partial [Candidatus Sulcia muelleri]|nr:hypothetical protein [Candidatus Karelsulcia muelleri]MCX2959622.1 hypothetical protein [Serratia symbiotica]